MIINTTLNYSPSFEIKKRKPNQIKFIIFHYTGMKNEFKAIKRLTSIKSKVSSHYLIKQTDKQKTNIDYRIFHIQLCHLRRTTSYHGNYPSRLSNILAMYNKTIGNSIPILQRLNMYVVIKRQTAAR